MARLSCLLILIGLCNSIFFVQIVDQISNGSLVRIHCYAADHYRHLPYWLTNFMYGLTVFSLRRCRKFETYKQNARNFELSEL